jgi:membrane protease YdiL (CAAX protease family)
MTTTSPQTQGAPEALLPDPAVSYKKGLRSTISRIVIATVLLVAFIAINGIAMPPVFETLFGMDILQGPFSWLSAMYFPLGVLGFLLVRGKKMFTKDLTAVNERMKVSDFVGLIALMAGVSSAFIFALLGVDLVLQAVGLSLPSGGAPSEKISLMAIIVGVIIAPICEEIIFRGAVLRALQPYGTNFAIVISALLFGLTHGFLFQAVNAFLLGLILAYCTLRFSIKWAMLLHALFNGIIEVFGFLPSVTLALMIRGIFLVLGIVAFILLFKKFRQQRKEGKAPGLPLSTEPGAVLASPRPFAIAFSSPWLIVFLLLIMGVSLYMLFML